MTYRYVMLTDDDQVALMRERLHQLEANHYKLTIELRLGNVTGEVTDEVDAGAKVQLAAMEVQVAALCEWLGVKVSTDA
jgi:hypothetical protein